MRAAEWKRCRATDIRAPWRQFCFGDIQISKRTDDTIKTLSRKSVFTAGAGSLVDIAIFRLLLQITIARVVACFAVRPLWLAWHRIHERWRNRRFKNWWLTEARHLLQRIEYVMRRRASLMRSTHASLCRRRWRPSARQVVGGVNRSLGRM